jgi:pantothenate kinase
MRASGGRPAAFGSDSKLQQGNENESLQVTKFFGFEFNHVEAIASNNRRLMSYRGIRESYD